MILITGATAGIGEATARIFAEAGESLLLIGRRKDRLDALARELSPYQVEIHGFPLDVRDREQVAHFFRAEKELIRRVRVLVNNAGLAKGMAPFQDSKPEDWDQMIDTNLKGLIAITRAILPYFIEHREGHIINLGSVAGHWTYPNGNIYCATKAAVHSFSECLRMDLNGAGIRVTEISPGMVETEFSEVRLGDAERAKAVYAGFAPLSARDIAETILWCVQRPKHVNIQDLVIYPTAQASPTLVSRQTAR